ncbi:hypothetical protein AIOL_002123 [Candidatus Rhodobacter oscarellae]|uniref:Uncharacterized protein n=1 Tax=Candidatus Rhodobacter oscarellae TaxID=1675527 RepID=A0A0J9E3A0_9RHOB|nr:hypothetical protein AIOL_002123 [Candidatus Rhodobacter lobularis]
MRPLRQVQARRQHIAGVTFECDALCGHGLALPPLVWPFYLTTASPTGNPYVGAVTAR